MELVSIIVPVYGVEAYIVECIESLINQSYKNIEILLIDDQSPDKCPEICFTVLVFIITSCLPLQKLKNNNV